jgi:hypothetical protein
MTDMYHLERKQDGSTIHGEFSIAILIGPDGEACYSHNARPEVGMFLFVGSELTHRGRTRLRGRKTSLITMIVSDMPTLVAFETQSGSRYVWRCSGVESSAIKAVRLH